MDFALFWSVVWGEEGHKVESSKERVLVRLTRRQPNNKISINIYVTVDPDFEPPIWAAWPTRGTPALAPAPFVGGMTENTTIHHNDRGPITPPRIVRSPVKLSHDSLKFVGETLNTLKRSLFNQHDATIQAPAGAR